MDNNYWGTEQKGTFYIVVGPNNNSQVCGRIKTLAKAVEQAEYWAKTFPGEEFFVMEATSISKVVKPTITKYL